MICAVAHAQAFAHARRAGRGSCSSTPCRRRRRSRCRRCAMPCAASITALRPGAADLVDGQRGDVIAEAASQRRLPRRRLAEPRRDDVAHDAFVHGVGSMPARRTASRTAMAPRSVAVKSFRRAEELAGGRPNGGDDDGFSHGDSMSHARGRGQPAGSAEDSGASPRRGLDLDPAHRHLRRAGSGGEGGSCRPTAGSRGPRPDRARRRTGAIGAQSNHLGGAFDGAARRRFATRNGPSQATAAPCAGWRRARREESAVQVSLRIAECGMRNG